MAWENWETEGSQGKIQVILLPPFDVAFRKIRRPGLIKELKYSFIRDCQQGVDTGNDHYRDFPLSVDAAGKGVCYRVYFKYNPLRRVLFLKYIEQVV